MKHAKSLQDSENQSTKPKRGGFKALRAQRRKLYYASRGPITIANKKRKMGAHLRAFPEDVRHVEQFTKRYGDSTAAGHLASPTSKARKRAMRRIRAAKRIAEIKHQLIQPAAPFIPPETLYVPVFHE